MAKEACTQLEQSDCTIYDAVWTSSTPSDCTELRAHFDGSNDITASLCIMRADKSIGEMFSLNRDGGASYVINNLDGSRTFHIYQVNGICFFCSVGPNGEDYQEEALMARDLAKKRIRAIERRVNGCQLRLFEGGKNRPASIAQ